MRLYRTDKQKKRIRKEQRFFTVIILVAFLSLFLCSCAGLMKKVNSYYNPEMKTPREMYTELCGENGKITEKCQNPGTASCREAEFVCEVIIFALGLIENQE